jgi:hypothetical protein
LAPFAALLLISVAGFLAFGPEPEPAAPPRGVGAAGAGAAASRSGRGFVLEGATWGVAEAAEAPPPPLPENPTAWQVREEAFENAMRERLRGVEVFVRGRTR